MWHLTHFQQHKPGQQPCRQRSAAGHGSHELCAVHSRASQSQCYSGLCYCGSGPFLSLTEMQTYSMFPFVSCFFHSKLRDLSKGGSGFFLCIAVCTTMAPPLSRSLNILSCLFVCLYLQNFTCCKSQAHPRLESIMHSCLLTCQVGTTWPNGWVLVQGPERDISQKRAISRHSLQASQSISLLNASLGVLPRQGPSLSLFCPQGCKECSVWFSLV